MRSRWMVLLFSGLLAAPAIAAPRGAYHVNGPRGGSVTHAQGAYRGGTVVHGPNGGRAVSTHGAYGGHAVYGRGPNGGRGYVGRPGYARPNYHWHGRYYARPGWAPGRVTTFNRGFYRYPGYRAYGTYGLVAPLAPFAGLAFLSAGLLTASYLANNRTVYVYVVQEDGQNVEYRVDDTGQILSQQVVP